MTATTPKGIPYPQTGIDYLIDAASHFQALAGEVDTLLDGYQLRSSNGLTHVVNTLSADTAPIGTNEVAVLTSDQFTLSAPTQVEISLSWDSVTTDSYGVVQWRLRPGDLNSTAVGGQRKYVNAGVPDAGGSLMACPLLPAGTYTILATLRTITGSVIVHASQDAPTTLLVRPLG